MVFTFLSVLNYVFVRQDVYRSFVRPHRIQPSYEVLSTVSRSERDLENVQELESE
jgi:hypothetical protein